MKKIIFGTSLFVLAFVLAGCGLVPNNADSDAAINTNTSNNNSTATASDNEKSIVEVSIKNFAYSPATLKIAKGTTVKWTNEDTAKHTVSPSQGQTEPVESGLFGKGESYQYTFNQLGTFNYYCLPHPWMKAQIIVE